MPIYLLLIVFALGFVAGYYQAFSSMVKRIQEDPDEFIGVLKKIKTEQESLEITGNNQACELRVEQHEQMFYLFKKENNEFVAQGKSLELAIKAAQARFPKLTYFYQKEMQ